MNIICGENESTRKAFVEYPSLEIEIPKNLLQEMLSTVEAGPFLYHASKTIVVFMKREEGIELWIHRNNEFCPYGMVPKEQLCLKPAEHIKFTIPRYLSTCS